MSGTRKGSLLEPKTSLTLARAKSANSTRHLLLKDLVGKLSTPGGFLSVLLANDERSGGGADLDFYWTIIRLHQVFSNVINNNSNNDAGPTQYEGALGWGMVGGGIAFTLIGFGRAIYQYMHAQYLKSSSYYRKQLKMLAPSQLENRDVQIDLKNKLIDRVEGFARTFNRTTLKKANGDKQLFANVDLTAPDVAQQLVDAFDDELLGVLISEKSKLKSQRSRDALVRKALHLIDIYRAVQIEEQLKTIKEKKALDYRQVISDFPKNERKPLPAFIRAVNVMRDNGFMDGVRTLWSWSGNYAYFYWLIWMPVVIIEGIAVAVNSVAVVLATLIAGSVFVAWNIGRLILQKCGVIAPDPTPEEKAASKEAERQMHEAKLRHFAVETHEMVMQTIYGKEVWGSKKAELTKAKEDGKLFGKRVLDVGETYPCYFKLQAIEKAKKDRHSLVRQLTGSKREQIFRRVIAATSAISTFVGFSFLMWFATTTLGVLLAPLLGSLGFTTASGVLATGVKFITEELGGAIIAAAAGGGFGVIGSLFDVAKIYTEQLEYKNNVYAVLSSQYKNTGKSIFEVHTGLTESLKEKLAALEAQANKLQPEHLKIINEIKLALNTKPHEGVRYFEKFEFATPVFSKLKQIWDGIYSFATRAQTGIFCARNLFLASGVAAGALAGITLVTGGTAFIPFMVVAVGLAIFIGTLGVVDAQLARRQAHREEAFKQLPAQIKTYKKWEQQLVAIDEVCGANKLTLSGADQSAAPNRLVKALTDLPIKKAEEFSSEQQSSRALDALLDGVRRPLATMAAPGKKSKLQVEAVKPKDGIPIEPAVGPVMS